MKQEKMQKLQKLGISDGYQNSEGILKSEKKIGKLTGEIKQESEKIIKGEITYLELTKKDLDKFSEYLDSDNFRNYGYGHFTLANGTLLTISCNELIKDRENYAKPLKKTGMKEEEIIRHLNNVNNIKEGKKLANETEHFKKQLEENKRLAEERLNQLKYIQADFDNYRKKFDKEKERIVKLANENLIKELIVILDDFESAIKVIENEKNKEGIELLQKKFFNILEKHGLKKIEALGKKFSSEFHEALCKELSKHNEDEIIEEIQKGYLLCSKVIRTSKVKVSKKDDKQDLKSQDKFEVKEDLEK